MAKRKLTVPLMERADSGNHDLNGICVSGRSLELLMEIKVSVIAAEVEAYNRYVDEHLPKRQRTGRIARKDLNRIVPWQRRRPRNVKRVIKMLKECIANEEVYRRTEPELVDGEFKRPKASTEAVALPSCNREPLPKMSIRIYAKYFRVAYEAYEAHFQRLYRRNKREPQEYAEFQEESSKLNDIEFYRRYQLVYDPIRDEVTEPKTVCAILARLYEKYGIGVGITNYNDHQHCYLYGWKAGDDKIQINDKEFISANEAMLTKLRMFA